MTNKKTKLTISILFILTFAISTITLPENTAQTTSSWKETYPFIVPIPDPATVNEEVLLWIGITDPSADYTGWKGLTITVTKPDSTIQTLGPYHTDSTGSTGATYIPTMVGTYQFQMHFPEQTVTAAVARTLPVGGVMKASDSKIVSLNVSSEPRTYWPSIPLPTEFWARPINSQFREWSSIGGNWLQNLHSVRPTTPHSQYAPFTEAPDTAHILWRTQDILGGIVGGELGQYSYSDGTAYESKFSAFAIGGILYQNAPWPARAHYQAVEAFDIHTGERLWTKNGTRMAFGQIMYWDTYNMQGAHAYIWDTSGGTTWKAYDASSGEWWFTLTNVPSGHMVFGPKGEILIYTVDQVHGWMTMWNSSNVPALYGAQGLPDNNPAFDYSWYSWRPYGKTVNAIHPFNVTAQTPTRNGRLHVE